MNLIAASVLCKNHLTHYSLDKKQSKTPTLRSLESKHRYKPQLLMRPYEKKTIREYVENSWKKIALIEDDKHRKSVLSKLSAKKTTELASHSAKSRKSNSVASIRGYTQPIHHHPDVSYDPMSSSIKKFTSLALKRQVSERTHGAKKIAETLRTLKERKAEEQDKSLRESQLIKEKLWELSRKMDVAADKLESWKFQKMLAATSSSQAVESAVERAELVNTERREEQEAQYMKKAAKIKMCGMRREKTMKELKRQKEDELSKKKQVHEKLFKRLQEKREKEKEMLMEDLKRKGGVHKRSYIEVIKEDYNFFSS